MKTFLILCTALLLVGCSYSVKVGKKCTPGSTEWSYVWLVKGDTDVSKTSGDYPTSSRALVRGHRQYTIGDFKLPSVTTILGQTQSEEKKQKLAEWRARLGSSPGGQTARFGSNPGYLYA